MRSLQFAKAGFSTFDFVLRDTLQWLIRSYERHTLRRATTRAYQRFAASHPQAVAELFDEHFVLVHVLPRLQDAGGAAVTPLQISELWARQMSVLPKLRQRHVAEMAPVAAQFLLLLAEEVAATRLGRQSSNLLQFSVR